MAPEETTAENLRQKLLAQAAQYREVLMLSQQQTECIRARDAGALMRILGEKQRIMQSLEAESQGLSVLLAAWEQERGAAPAAARSAVEEAHAEVRDVLAEVLAAEEAGQRELGQYQQQSGADLRQMQRGKQVLKAYGAAPPSERGRFTDKRQ